MSKGAAKPIGGSTPSVSQSCAKSLKRDFELVSPMSPETPVTMSNIRALFVELLVPISTDLEDVKKVFNFNQTDLNISYL